MVLDTQCLMASRSREAPPDVLSRRGGMYCSVTEKSWETLSLYEAAGENFTFVPEEFGRALQKSNPVHSPLEVPQH